MCAITINSSNLPMVPKYRFLDLGAVNAPYVDAIAEATARVVRSGRYVGGHEVESFEQMLAADTGTAYAVGVSSGLDALRGARSSSTCVSLLWPAMAPPYRQLDLRDPLWHGAP